MSVFGRNRIVVPALVAAFVAAFAALGAVGETSTPVVAEAVPTSPWYWAMAVAPSDSDVLVLGTSDGLYRSGNGGKTWQATGPKRFNATSLVELGSSIFVGGVRVPAGSRSPVTWKGASRVAPDGVGVLAASADGGKTWRELHPRGLPKISLQALTTDPANPAALYALLNNGKLYRSTDTARSFQLVSSKLGVPPWSLAITHDGLFVAGNMESGHHVSTNGKTWKQTSYKDSKGDRHVMEFAVQPTDPTRVLMTSTGVEMSTDGGKTWHVTLKSTAMFGPVAWAPTKSQLAYAVGFDHSLWRSDDSGKSWKKVS